MYQIKRECLSKTNQELAECNGGQRCCIYQLTDSIASFDKGDHKLRSLAAQPNHRKHWKKTEIREPMANERLTSG